MAITDQTFEDAPEEVECPYELEHVWSWYIDLDCTREVGMVINPIAYREIQAWSQLNKIDIRPIEVESIRAIDIEYMKYQNSKDTKNG